MTHEEHSNETTPAATGTGAQAGKGAGMPLPRALTDGILCGVGCYHLRRTVEGDPLCQAFDDEELHPSFDAAVCNGAPRAERCTDCLVAEDLFGRAGR